MQLVEVADAPFKKWLEPLGRELQQKLDDVRPGLAKVTYKNGKAWRASGAWSGEHLNVEFANATQRTREAVWDVVRPFVDGKNESTLELLNLKLMASGARGHLWVLMRHETNEGSSRKVPFHRQLAYQFCQELEAKQEELEEDGIITYFKVHHSAVPHIENHPRADEYCSQVEARVWGGSTGGNGVKKAVQQVCDKIVKMYEEKYSGDFMPVETAYQKDFSGGGYNLYFEYWPINEYNPWQKVFEAKGDLLNKIAEKLLRKFNQVEEAHYEEQAQSRPYTIRLMPGENPIFEVSKRGGNQNHLQLAFDILRLVAGKYNQKNILQVDLHLQNDPRDSTWKIVLTFKDE